MPEIDVSDLVFDVMVAGEPFIIVRRATVVNDYGERVDRTERITAYGSVTPVGDNSLAREITYQAGSRAIHVITRELMRTASVDGPVTYQPDLVIWRNDYYVVTSVNDYSQYGGGHTEADCISTDYVPQAPVRDPVT